MTADSLAEESASAGACSGSGRCLSRARTGSPPSQPRRDPRPGAGGTCPQPTGRRGLRGRGRPGRANALPAPSSLGHSVLVLGRDHAPDGARLRAHPLCQGGFRMDWDPAKGPAAPIHLHNHPSALAEAAFVSEVVSAGVAASTMRTCTRDELICVLPLGVAFNSAEKRRLICDGRHVNALSGSARSTWRHCNGRAAPSLSAAPTEASRSIYRLSSLGYGGKRVPLPRIGVGKHFLLFRSAPFRAFISPLDFHDSDRSLRKIPAFSRKGPDGVP